MKQNTTTAHAPWSPKNLPQCRNIQCTLPIDCMSVTTEDMYTTLYMSHRKENNNTRKTTGWVWVGKRKTRKYPANDRQRHTEGNWGVKTREARSLNLDHVTGAAIVTLQTVNQKERGALSGLGAIGNDPNSSFFLGEKIAQLGSFPKSSTAENKY